MTCHHSPGDPNCTSNQRVVYRDRPDPPTPDAEKFTIVNAVDVGPHLVLKVMYPNCPKCTFEGMKVMVFTNVSPLDALKWKRIDPHFRDPKEKQRPKSAPAPKARFPADDEGWKDALDYANRRV